MTLLITSCAHVISKETRETARKDASFKVIRENVANYTGSVFIWGGFIAGLKAEENVTYLEIVQNPIGKYGNILDPDISEGRFLALYNGELDPLIYEKGRMVTLAGELKGDKTIKRRGREYTYPLLEVKELYLWKEEPVIFPFYWERSYYWPYSQYYAPWPYYPAPYPY